MRHLFCLPFLVVLALSSLALGDNTANCGPRIRKSWESLSSDEKETYISAMELAMSKGYISLFAQVHAESMSTNEAHNTCGFLLWHRRFLLAVENMLRSFGPKYKCITLPYWDFYGEYALRSTGKCKNMEDCSGMMKDLGGGMDVNAARQNVQVGIERIYGPCSRAGPVGKFCEAVDMNPRQCAGCIPRGDRRQRNLPGALGYAGLVGIFQDSRNGYRDLSINIVRKAHNALHSVSDRAMATLLIYLSCNVGRYMDQNEVFSSKLAYEECFVIPGAIRDSSPNIKSHFLMQVPVVTDNGIIKVPVEEHKVMGPWFEDLPANYFQTVDTGDMGKYTYSYELSQLTANILFSENNNLQCTPHDSRRRLTALYQSGNASFTLSTNNELGVLEPTSVVTTSQSVCTAQDSTLEWFNQIFAKMMSRTNDNVDKTLQNIQFLQCQFHQKYVGEVEDYSPLFREQFMIAPTDHAFCYKLLNTDTLQSEDSVHLDDWEDSFQPFFNP